MTKAKPLRLLIVLQWWYPIGGIEVFVTNLVKSLPADIVLGLAIEVHGQLVVFPALLTTHATVWRFKERMRPSQFRAVVRGFRPDVIHFNNFTPPMLIMKRWAQRQGIPTVVTLHQVPENLLTWRKLPFVSIGWLFMRQYCVGSRTVVTPSAYINKLCYQHGLTAVTISCGVDTELFRPGIPSSAREQLALSNRPTVLFVGRFGREKNGARLLQAVHNLSQRLDLQLVMIGFPADLGNTDNALADLLTASKQSGTVIMPGFIPHESANLPLYYQAANVVAIPSLFETQSLVALESLASGVPVCAGNVGALPDLIIPGKTGELCTPFDIADIETSLEKLLACPPRKVVLDASHQLPVIAHAYAEVYHSATAKTGA